MDTLSITSTRPVLEITTRPAKLNIRAKRQALKIRRSPAYMQINKKAPTFKVNSLDVRSGIGLTPIMQLSRQMADESQQKVMQAIADIVERGNMLKSIEGNSNPIAAIAEQRVMPPRPEFNIALMPPQDSPLEWDLGYFKVEWSQHNLELDWLMDVKPNISCEPHSVEVKIRNHPEVKIKVNKNTVRNTVGSKVDKKI